MPPVASIVNRPSVTDTVRVALANFVAAVGTKPSIATTPSTNNRCVLSIDAASPTDTVTEYDRAGSATSHDPGCATPEKFATEFPCICTNVSNR